MNEKDWRNGDCILNHWSYFLLISFLQRFIGPEEADAREWTLIPNRGPWVPVFVSGLVYIIHGDCLVYNTMLYLVSGAKDSSLFLRISSKVLKSPFYFSHMLPCTQRSFSTLDLCEAVSAGKTWKVLTLEDIEVAQMKANIYLSKNKNYLRLLYFRWVPLKLRSTESRSRCCHLQLSIEHTVWQMGLSNVN